MVLRSSCDDDDLSERRKSLRGASANARAADGDDEGLAGMEHVRRRSKPLRSRRGRRNGPDAPVLAQKTQQDT